MIKELSEIELQEKEEAKLLVEKYLDQIRCDKERIKFLQANNIKSAEEINVKNQEINKLLRLIVELNRIITRVADPIGYA